LLSRRVKGIPIASANLGLEIKDQDVEATGHENRTINSTLIKSFQETGSEEHRYSKEKHHTSPFFIAIMKYSRLCIYKEKHLFSSQFWRFKGMALASALL
jgi:hypothetical protein